MMRSFLLHLVLLLPASTSGFTVGPSGSISRARIANSVALEMVKGFDKNSKPIKREKSAGQVKREKMSNQYDTIAASGGQEYSVFVRQFGGEDTSWLPCGSIAVPRNGQVSDAIFANEEALKVAIVRTFPKLKGFESEFEFGYNLKIFPDDPIEVAVKQTKVAGPSIGNWLSNLLSPIDASSGSTPSS